MRDRKWQGWVITGMPPLQYFAMANNEDVPVYLTSQEYQQLTSMHAEFNLQQEKHQQTLAELHNTRDKDINALTRVIEAHCKNNEALEGKVSSLGQVVKMMEAQLRQLDQLAQKTSVQQADESHQLKEKMAQTEASLKLELDNKQNRIQELQKTLTSINDVQKEQRLAVEEFQREHAEVVEELRVAKQQLSGGSSKELLLQVKKMEVEKEQLQSKLAALEMRMQSKEEFVCNYYQSLKVKLQDFDEAQVKSILSHDIDDFIRYLTKTKNSK